MAPSTIRLGIVGAGGIVKQRHIPGFAKLENVSVVAVCNRSRESSEAFAQKYNVPTVYSDWRELVSTRDIDAVVIGTWPYLHKEISVAALSVGKHVFCQARMARNAAEAREMEDAWKNTGLTAMLCPPPIALHASRVIRRILDSGDLGQILSVQVRHLDGAYLDASLPLSWRLNRTYQGVNTLFLGMYAEVLHRWFGPTQWVLASTRIHTRERNNLEIQRMERVEIAEEVFAIAGMRGHIHVQYALSGLVAHGGECSIEVFGSDGTLKYVLQNEQVWFGKKGSPMQPVPVTDEEFQPWNVEADFIHAVREGIPDPSPSFSEGVLYMDVTEAVYRSVQTGSKITLPLV